MSHEWHAGILTQSSWHGLEEVGILRTAEEMIAAGTRTNAYATDIQLHKLFADGIPVPGFGVIATYANGQRVGQGHVGDRYRPTEPEEFHSLIRAAGKAGARPMGAFSLRGGSRVLATFEVGEETSGIKTFLNIIDALDGSLHLSAGKSSVRVVCANTLSAARSADGKRWAKVRHTASAADKIATLAEAIEETVKSGQETIKTYQAAEETRLTKTDVAGILEALFPPAPEDASKGAQTRAENARTEMLMAMQRKENFAGPTLATVWNGATWLVDRDGFGNARKTRGDALDSLLTGTRGQRIHEIENIVEVVLRDGSIERVAVPELAAKQAAEGNSEFERLIRA